MKTRRSATAAPPRASLWVAALLLAALLLGACNPCAERCRVAATKYDDCLAEWGMEWADLDAADFVDYRRSCLADESVHDAGRSSEERTVEHGLCADLVTDLRASSTCDEIWEALVQYGADP